MVFIMSLAHHNVHSHEGAGCLVRFQSVLAPPQQWRDRPEKGEGDTEPYQHPTYESLVLSGWRNGERVNGIKALYKRTTISIKIMEFGNKQML